MAKGSWKDLIRDGMTDEEVDKLLDQLDRVYPKLRKMPKNPKPIRTDEGVRRYHPRGIPPVEES